MVANHRSGGHRITVWEIPVLQNDCRGNFCPWIILSRKCLFWNGLSGKHLITHSADQFFGVTYLICFAFIMMSVSYNFVVRLFASYNEWSVSVPWPLLHQCITAGRFWL